MVFAATLLHGVFAVLLIAGLGWTGLQLARVGETKSADGARKASWLALGSSLVLNALGTYSYISYRVDAPGTPRSIILETQPWVHRILFESMEYVGIMVPLGIAVIVAAISVYGKQLPKESHIATLVNRLVYAMLFIVLLMSVAGFLPSLIAFAK